ncbi:hypothetical protein LAZ67_5002898 [Cordylochernes scorpioides]|uniref:CCHC-type domain-containing protein n=1 Tax=Cordylochernes scorpioides TaxID=51811 RepID=A0ABY6KKB1_9ARAC|nr:hypothetical protein LAZ67_5002898 [Cordylochernes scorpioides]
MPGSLWQPLQDLLPHLLAVRSSIEVDQALQEFASTYCQELWKRQENGPPLTILNADGLYLATYSALLLNLKLLHSGYYSTSLKSAVPLTELAERQPLSRYYNCWNKRSKDWRGANGVGDPPSTAVAALRSTVGIDPKAQTLNNLTARLLIEETRNQQSGSSKQDEALLHRQARTKPKDTQRSFQDAKKNTKCHYCHKIGHWSRECRKRLANEKNKSKNLHDSKGSSSDYGLILCDNQVEPNDIWYADSGASCSMTFRREWFKTYTPFSSDHPIYLGDNSTLLAEGMGDIEIQAYVDGGWYNTYIRNVLYSPQLKKNLYSLSTSTRRGFNVIIKHDKLQMFMDNDLKAVGVRHDDLYRMLFKVTSSSQGYITSENKLQLWHERLAHLPVATLREMATKGLVDGLQPQDLEGEFFFCEGCQLGKAHRKSCYPSDGKNYQLGYENTSKNFRLWDWKTRKIRISKDVTFDEKATSDRESTKPKEIIFQINGAPDESPVATANIPVQEMPPVSDISSHPMITRSKVSNSKCNFALADEPRSYIDAITSSDSERWKLAMDEEIDALNKNKTWTLERLADGHKPIGCKWVYKIKTESDGTIQRFKARLVAKGYSQIKNVDYFDTFSPVVRFDSLRILLSHAASERMFLKQFDVKTAFLNGELEELVYLEQPEGYKRDDNSCYRLHKSLSLCDDGIILSKDKEAIAIIMDELEHAFDITSGSVNFFVGLQIEQSEDRASIFIHQSSYIDKILSKFNMADCIPASVPMDPSVILTKQDCPTPEQKEKMPKFPFREAVGSLMFASCVSRPDITYAVSQVSKFLEYPGPAHCTTVKNIFHYLKGTPHMGILFTGQDQLVGYSDSDFARDVDSRKSTTGYAFMMNGGTVSWASQRQPIIALSTTESEYIAACSAAKELIWIRRLLQGIGCDITKETELYIDNQAAIKLVENPVFHKRTKHIDVRYHFIRSKHEEATWLAELYQVVLQKNLLGAAGFHLDSPINCSLTNLLTDVWLVSRPRRPEQEPPRFPATFRLQSTRASCCGYFTLYRISSRNVSNGDEELTPDLAPCDFFLFGKLKKKLKGRKYQSIEEIKLESKKAMKAIPKTDYQRCFADWKKRKKLARRILTCSWDVLLEVLSALFRTSGGSNIAVQLLGSAEVTKQEARREAISHSLEGLQRTAKVCNIVGIPVPPLQEVLIKFSPHKSGGVLKGAQLQEVLELLSQLVERQHATRTQEISKKAVSTIHDIVRNLLSRHTELPHFHFNEALFKPFENLLCLELCEYDVQEQIIGSICEFVEGSSEEIHSGWRALFAALRAVQLPAEPEPRAEHLRAVLDVLEAFLAASNMLVFSYAAVDCLMCLLQHVRKLLQPQSVGSTDWAVTVGGDLEDDCTEETDHQDLSLSALKYLERCGKLLASAYRMPSCPVFHSGNRVWFLLLEGLMGTVVSCPRRYQSPAIDTLFSFLRQLCEVPGAEFALYCVNHLLLPSCSAGCVRPTCQTLCPASVSVAD